tara:strand:- start:53 stop:742 length:690 start_codon:yes stop_codon:yes gene_type:complete
MVQHFRLVGFALFLSVGMGSGGSAASFDCNKATTATEIAICGDPELSALDEEIARVYFSLSKDGRYYSDLIKSQREWVKFERTIDAYDFKRRLAFLRFGSHLNTCLMDTSDQKWWADCKQQLSNISDECQKLENYTTVVMGRCASAYTEILDLVEKFETNMFRERTIDDQETLKLFDEAYLLWQHFTKSDCSWQYSYYREGTISGQIYAGCMMGHFESKIKRLHFWNVR